MIFLKKTIAILILFVIIGCKETGQSSNDLKEQQQIDIKKVWIIGNSDDSQALKYFNLQDEAALFSINHIKKTEVNKDSLEIVLDSISSSRFLEVASGGNNSLYQARVYIVPGDTILFEIKNKKIRFHGKNANLHNFYTDLFHETPMYLNNPYKGNLYSYKREIDSIYDLKKAFFNNYIKEKKITSKNFIEIVKGDLKQQYLFGLIIPKNINTGYSDIYNVDMYRGDHDGLIPIVNAEFGYGEKLFDVNYYFDNVSIDDFKETALIENSKRFKVNINQFIRYYFDTSSAEPFSEEKLMSEKSFIEKNFDGEIKKFAIARMISDYEKKGFGYSKMNINVLKKVIKEYENKFIDQSYKDKMISINNSLDAFGFKLSDAALNYTKLLSLEGDTLTLNDIFKRSNKRIRVIDFWASWCPPCIDEIKKAKDFKDKIAIEKDVEWIYLSIDKDEDKWRKASKNLSEFLNVRNQYLILGGQNTSLCKELNIEFIPRYVIFNKDNEIVLENAPLPSNSIVFKNVIDEISINKN